MDKGLRRMGKRIGRHGFLLLLCWLVYTCSLVGKVNYAANITQVETFFGVSHANAGMVSTFYFFAYGAGQIFNGVFCKKYNLKYTVFGALLVSGLANLFVGLTTSFTLIKYLWLVNGIALSVLWPSLIRLLSETLKREEMARASIVMGTTTAIGTFFVYGLSAVYVAIGVFRFSFYTATAVLSAVAIVWLLLYNKLTKKEETEEEEAPIPSAQTPSVTGEKPKGLFSCICILAVFAIATNLVKDGLTTWVPSILKESYGLSDSLSILLTLTLPVVAVFGNIIAQKIYKRVPDFVALCSLLFLAIGGLLGGVIGFLNTELFIVTLVLFAAVSCLASGSNSTITSIFPLYMKGKVNSGMIAGVLNGFCYIGSTVSSYGLGFVADEWGWNAVFYLLLAVCAFVFLVGFAYTLVRAVKTRKTFKK